MFKTSFDHIKEKIKYGSLNFYYIILLAIAYFYFISGLFYYNIPVRQDPIPLRHRGYIILFTISLLILSYLNDWTKEKIETVTYILVYSVLIHLAYIAYLNFYDSYLALVLIAFMIIINLFFKGNKVAFYCNIVMALFVGSTLFITEELSISFKLYYFAIYLSAALFSFVVSYQKVRASNSLDSLNQKQNILLNNIDTQIWYLKDYDRYGKVNQAHADFLGLNKEDIENKKLSDVVSPEEAKINKTVNKKIFKEKTKIKSEEWLENYEGEKKLLKIIKTPKLDKEDEVEYVVSTALDITERKKAEAKTLERKQMYENVVETQKEMICRFLPDTTLTFVNEAYCKNFNKSKENLLGKKFIELIPEKEHAKIFEHLQNLARNKEIITYQHEVISDEKRSIWQEWTDYLIYDDKGNIKEFQSIGLDITEKKKKK